MESLLLLGFGTLRIQAGLIFKGTVPSGSREAEIFELFALGESGV